MHAYRNIHGKFINVNTVSEKENNIIENEDVRVNMVSEIEKKKRRNHFDRFNHSIVEIKYKGINKEVEKAKSLSVKGALKDEYGDSTKIC